MSYTLTVRVWKPEGIEVERTTHQDLGEASRSASAALHDQSHGHHRTVILTETGKKTAINWANHT